MKKIMVMLAPIVLSTSVYAQQNIKSIDIGEMVPMADVKMQSVDKKEISLNDAKSNNGLLVMFSCNTCPYVIKSQARTNEMVAYAKQQGIGVVIVNSSEGKRDGGESYKEMVKYAKEQDYAAPYVLDTKSKLADAFGAARTPEVFLFDGRGVLMYKGAMEDNPSTPAESTKFFLKDAINRIMAGTIPEPPVTKSIGCAIKRAI